MRKDIKPIYIQGLDCIDNTIISICSYLFGNCQNLFWDALQFKYHNDYCIGKGLDWDDRKIVKNAEKLYGMYFQSNKISNVEGKQRLIENFFVKKDAMILAVRTNICSWQESYGSSNYTIHYVMIIDIVKNGIICNDCMPKKEDVFLSWEQLRYGLEGLITISIKDKRSKFVSLNDIYKTVRKQLKIRDVEKMKKRISKDLDIQREFGIENKIRKIALYNLFLKVTGGHIQFSQYLDSCLNEKELSEEVLKTAVLWEELKLMTVKIHMKYSQGQYISDKQIEEYRLWYKNKLETIILNEKQFVETLRNILNTKQYIRQANMMQIENVELVYNESSHFLNNEFDVEIEKLLKIIKHSQSIKTEKNHFNCIFCDGQEIRVNKMIKGIVLIGYATYGTQFDFIKIRTDYNKIIEISLAFSDWTEEKLIQEKVLWESDFKTKTEKNVNYIGKLVEKRIELGKINCQSIILPQNKYIHIFKFGIIIEK